jgi:hypothetical protein
VQQLFSFASRNCDAIGELLNPSTGTALAIFRFTLFTDTRSVDKMVALTGGGVIAQKQSTTH